MSRVELNEPIIKALVALLKENLGVQVAAINNEMSDDFLMDPPVDVLPYMPFALTLERGMPIVAVQDLPTTFDNDLQFSMESESTLGIAAILQTSDHSTLAWQLRRYVQAIVQVIQADRMLGVSSVLRSQAQVIYTEFLSTEPGPMLGDRDPDADGVPPTSFRSWTWLLIKCRRQEIGG